MTVHECVYAAIPAGKPAETTVSGTGNILPSAGTGELSESSELVEKSANEPGFSPRENSPAGIADLTCVRQKNIITLFGTSYSKRVRAV